MSSSAPAADDYRRQQASFAQQVSTRAAERDALMRITSQLESARDSGDRDALSKAVTQNQTLWMLFVTDVTKDENQLPPDLKRQIASVGMSVIREMTDNRDGTPDLDFLIDINRLFIEGLASAEAA
jgi:flagellar protein FlaF